MFLKTEQADGLKLVEFSGQLATKHQQVVLLMRSSESAVKGLCSFYKGCLFITDTVKQAHAAHLKVNIAVRRTSR